MHIFEVFGSSDANGYSPLLGTVRAHDTAEALILARSRYPGAVRVRLVR